VAVARNCKQDRASDIEVDSEEQIWNTIRYLDPDSELRKSDIVLSAIWTPVFVFLGLFISCFTVEGEWAS
jgi:hypothetical protein